MVQWYEKRKLKGNSCKKEAMKKGRKDRVMERNGK